MFVWEAFYSKEPNTNNEGFPISMVLMLAMQPKALGNVEVEDILVGNEGFFGFLLEMAAVKS